MKLTNTAIILLLATTTVGGALLAWRQYGELVELRAAALNRDERAELQKRVWDLEKANRELQDQLAAARDSEEVEEMLDAAAGVERQASRDRSPREGDRSGRGGDSRGRGSGIQQAVAIRELMNKPEVQAMVGVQLKGAIEARYAALFKNLNLPVEQIDRLKTLLAERTTTIQDVVAAAREQGINPREDPEAYRKLITDAQNQINNSIKATIGEQGFAQLTNYEQTLPQRSIVSALEQRLSYTNTPLTPTQAEQMVQILAANTPQRQPATQTGAPKSGTSRGPGSPASGRGGPPIDFRSVGRGDMGAVVLGGGPMPGMGLDAGRGSAPVTSAAVAQAQTVLAPPQLSALQQIQQQQQTQQQLRQLMSDTLKANQPVKSGGGAKPGGAPATGGTKRRG